MNILITAPSLDVNKNVSGISSVVNTIIANNKEINYTHFLSGREDGQTSPLQRIAALSKGYLLLVNILKKKNINLVHLNLSLNPKSIYREYLFFQISKLFKKKVILHLHGGKYLLQRPSSWLLKRMMLGMYQNSERVVCLSSFEKEIIQNTYKIDNLGVLENTIDNQFLDLHKDAGVNGPLVVLFMGRLHESKGIHVILASIRNLIEKGQKNIQFIFCGLGPLLGDILQLEQQYPRQVHYMGVVNGKMKNDMLARAQVFILPSLYGEGLPMALLEAMAAGLVPIVTNDGSINNVVTHGKTGFIIKKNDPALLTSQIEELLADPDNLKAISKNVKTYAVNNFSISRYVTSLNELYRMSAG
jgi:glycosyltransferase involved in cell wall biosynthesis